MFLLLLLAAWSTAQASPSQGDGRVRGMTISCPTWGPEWGSDEMVQDMARLKELGATWIAIHPYASIQEDGALGRMDYLDPENPPIWLTRPIEEAQRMGLKILIKPHLAYWRTSFTWRGEIEFSTEEQWQRFFQDYEEWTRRLLKICQKADAFAVGTELDRTLHREQDWRRIIRISRELYSGHLTYAANWTDYHRVPFWDALDAVGIQGYFPILSDSSKRIPTRRELELGWQEIRRTLREYSLQVERPIVLTELGYNLSFQAPWRPWEYDVDGHAAEALQVDCLDIALSTIEQEPTIVGAFLWKWYPGAPIPRNFSMESPVILQLLEKLWRPTRG